VTRLRELLERSRWPALASWVLVAGLAAVTVANVYYEQYLWASFALAASVLVVLPSVVYRDPAVTLHWPVVALAVLPILGRTLGSNPTFVRGTTYLSVAAVALVLAVELDAFSPVRLTPRLAVVFVVLATMATAGVWAIVQWSADAVLATSFVEGKTAMMWDLVGATVAGVLAAGLFELYFREEEPDGYPTGSPERVS
jgi:hypothetical protein